MNLGKGDLSAPQRHRPPQPNYPSTTPSSLIFSTTTAGLSGRPSLSPSDPPDPVQVREAESLAIFKTSLKTFLFEKAHSQSFWSYSHYGSQANDHIWYRIVKFLSFDLSYAPTGQGCRGTETWSSGSQLLKVLCGSRGPFPCHCSYGGPGPGFL